MKTKEVTEFYGTQQLAADAIGIAQNTVASWGDEPPLLRQIQYEIASKKKLKANPAAYGPGKRTERAAA